MKQHINKCGPGKFEGEPCYAPAFWELTLTGCGDEFYDGNDRPYSRFAITAEDVTAFPCCLDTDDIGKVLVLCESDQGFVCTEVMTATAADAFQAECEATETVEA